MEEQKRTDLDSIEGLPATPATYILACGLARGQCNYLFVDYCENLHDQALELVQPQDAESPFTAKYPNLTLVWYCPRDSTRAADALARLFRQQGKAFKEALAVGFAVDCGDQHVAGTAVRVILREGGAS
jgi:hypothetical protein